MVVERLNRLMTGWAAYFCVGQVSPAYNAVNQHAIRMREIRTSSLMSGDRKPGYGSWTDARRESDGPVTGP